MHCVIFLCTCSISPLTAVPCTTLSDPEHGQLQCYDPYGPFHFNSSCQFHCDLGYQVEGPALLRCQTSGLWDHPAPVCQGRGYWSAWQHVSLLNIFKDAFLTQQWNGVRLWTKRLTDCWWIAAIRLLLPASTPLVSSVVRTDLSCMDRAGQNATVLVNGLLISQHVQVKQFLLLFIVVTIVGICICIHALFKIWWATIYWCLHYSTSYIAL